jgi:hypothetical protein
MSITRAEAAALRALWLSIENGQGCSLDRGTKALHIPAAESLVEKRVLVRAFENGKTGYGFASNSCERFAQSLVAHERDPENTLPPVLLTPEVICESLCAETAVVVTVRQNGFYFGCCGVDERSQKLSVDLAHLFQRALNFDPDRATVSGLNLHPSKIADLANDLEEAMVHLRSILFAMQSRDPTDHIKLLRFVREAEEFLHNTEAKKGK